MTYNKKTLFHSKNNLEVISVFNQMILAFPHELINYLRRP